MLPRLFLLCAALAKQERCCYNCPEGRDENVSKVIVIGGGAAGMAAAIAASWHGDDVTVLERMDRVGKKLLATGNGRCNLMNTGALRYPGGAQLAREVLRRCGAREQAAFWHMIGLRLRQEEGGRVYPVSGQASSVLDTLRLAMDSRHVRIETGQCVSRIVRRSDGFDVITQSGVYHGTRVIVAGGGMAQPKLGSDGSCYALLAAMKHPIVSPSPCLTQILTDTAPIRGLSGIRARGTISVWRGERMLHQEAGEVLFADYGVSGVCAMQCARYADAGTELRLNLAQGMGLTDMCGALSELTARRARWSDAPAEALLTGLCVPRLAQALMSASGCSFRAQRMRQLPDRSLQALSAVMAAFPLTVRGVKGFETAQVTCGGAAADGFDPATMASRLCTGLYAAGEVLDVDGDCGGYNLMFAFGSGLLAGLNGRPAPWAELEEERYVDY